MPATTLRFGSKPEQRTTVRLTATEAKRLRDHLMALFPLSAPCTQVSDVALAAMAVEAARAKGKQ